MSLPGSRALSVGFAAIGLVALAGCAAEQASATDSGTSTSSDSSSTSYADGTYTADGSYQAPSGTETITVELTISDDVVTAVSVTQNSSDPQAQQFQSQFASGISSAVVGKDLSSLSVSRVSGSSLTSSGFNAALDEIRSQAA